MPPGRVTSAEPLCCCEYENIRGEKSHILACCCDCDALDEAFDRCITCQKIPPRMQSSILNTIKDRCRLPGIFGHGAVRVRPDIAVPIVTVPLCIVIATIGPIMTGLSLSFMPLFMLFFYRSWSRNTEKSQTPFFFLWGLISVSLMFVSFQSFVVGFRRILLWENILLSTAFAMMMYYMALAKSRARSLKPHSTYSARRMEDIYSSDGNHGNSPDDASERTKEYTQVNVGDKNRNTRKESWNLEEIASLREEDVTWVDSRPITNGKLITWCSECSVKKPPRSGHCTVCRACIDVRDHHCVWIDCCIGASNHAHFMVAMVLFVFCGFYGAHLTITTICTPKMYLEWFLLPNDCRFLYVDFQTAMSFVSALYCVLASGLMMCNLLYQSILISQNITSQEMHMAYKRGLTTCYGLVATKNVHNRGFIRNWWRFFTTKRNAGNLVRV